ncbi:MAG: alpha/beta hydrolase [Actinomycetota bacterium]
MSITTLRSRRLAEEPAGKPAQAPRRLPWLIGLQAVALVLLVGMHGSDFWRSIRIATVLAGSALLLLGIRGITERTGWIALLAGIVGVVAGGGIGFRSLQKAGVSVIGVAGSVALITGLVLLIAGAAMAIRRVKGWRRAWTIPIGLVVLLFVIYPITMALAATNVPPIALGTATPASRGIAYEDVTFTTSDGVVLSGWYIPSQNRAAVVLLHGSGSTRSGVLGHAVVLAQYGYGVLLFDARGHGRSGGTGMDSGWYGDLDTRAAVTFLTRRADVDPTKIAAIGMSMGGEEAIGAAASDARIRTVVGEGVTHRVYADTTEWLPRSWNGWLQRGIDRVVYGAMDLTTGASPPIGIRSALIATAPRPVLLIAAGNVADEQAAARAFVRGLTNVQTWTVPGAGHTGGLTTHPSEWTARVTAFLHSALGV